MKQRVEEMEREAKKLRELQAAAESQSVVGGAATDRGVPMETEEERAVADSRSIFVGNVGLDIWCRFPHFPSLKWPSPGRLRCNPRRDSGTFPGLRDYQSSDYPLRQIHGSP